MDQSANRFTMSKKMLKNVRSVSNCLVLPA